MSTMGDPPYSTMDDTDSGSWFQNNKTSVYAVGGIAVVVVGYFLLKSRSSASSTTSAASGLQAGSSTPVVDLIGNASGSGTSTAGTSTGGSSSGGMSNSITQLESLMAALGQYQNQVPNNYNLSTGGGGSSITGGHGVTQVSTNPTPVTSVTSPQPVMGYPPMWSIPSNPYPVGTNLTPLGGNAGESVTRSVYDPAVGSWLNLTNQGGVYTSAGLPLSGSAIGKGNFAGGNISFNGNQFTETTPGGQSYTYSVN